MVVLVTVVVVAGSVEVMVEVDVCVEVSVTVLVTVTVTVGGAMLLVELVVVEPGPQSGVPAGKVLTEPPMIISSFWRLEF